MYKVSAFVFDSCHQPKSPMINRMMNDRLLDA